MFMLAPLAPIILAANAPNPIVVYTFSGIASLVGIISVTILIMNRHYETKLRRRLDALQRQHEVEQVKRDEAFEFQKNQIRRWMTYRREQLMAKETAEKLEAFDTRMDKEEKLTNAVENFSKFRDSN